VSLLCATCRRKPHTWRPSLPCATGLLHEAHESRKRVTTPRHVVSTRGTPPTSTQGGRGARPRPHPPTRKGADGVTPGQEEQVSLLLGVCLSSVQRAAGPLTCSATLFALCNRLTTQGKPSRKRVTVLRHVVPTRGTPPPTRTLRAVAVHDPSPPRPTNDGKDGTTPGQEEQVSLPLGVCPSCEHTCRKALDLARPALPLCNRLVAEGEGSSQARHDTLCPREEHPLLAQPGRSRCADPSAPLPLTRARTGPLPDRKSR
jgi:hypothetical protein